MALEDTQARMDSAKSSRMNGHGDEAQPIKILTLDEFVQRPSLSSQVRGIVPKGALVVVFGPPKGGKTFSVCDLTMHAAHGLDWHGCAIPRRMRVVYLCGEGVNGLRVRLKAWQEHHDNIEETGEFHILPQALSLPDRTLSLVETLRAINPDIVVTDTLNAYFGGGDENSTHDMTTWCGSIRYLRDCLDCSVIVIHHTGHGDSGRERGSIVLRATADVLIQVAKDEGAGELVGFQVITARDLEPMESPIALKLARHETEWLDEDGQPLVSCVVLAADQPVTLPGRGGRRLGEAQAMVLQAAQELARAAKPDHTGEVFLGRQDVAKLAKDRGGVSKQSISSAWGPLAKRGCFRLVEPGSIAMRVRT
jgi:AAA domain